MKTCGIERKRHALMTRFAVQCIYNPWKNVVKQAINAGEKRAELVLSPVVRVAKPNRQAAASSSYCVAATHQ